MCSTFFRQQNFCAFTKFNIIATTPQRERTRGHIVGCKELALEQNVYNRYSLLFLL
jgi:hypothetical protein